jgi:TfoX/Sxy family transcriptional regulator of competence genes
MIAQAADRRSAMAYDEQLARRVRSLLEGCDGYSERKMFGGLCCMLHGNMCCGVVGGELMLRLGEAGAEQALFEPHVREMDFTGRPMKSMVYVAAAGIKQDSELRRWVELAAEFASSLPPK